MLVNRFNGSKDSDSSDLQLKIKLLESEGIKMARQEGKAPKIQDASSFVYGYQ
jgi:hypothetical protein